MITGIKKAMIKQSDLGSIVFMCMGLSKNFNVKTGRLRIYEYLTRHPLK